MSFLSRLRSYLPSAARAAEGEFRPGPYFLNDGWLPDGAAWNFWQLGQDVHAYGSASAMVEACVSRYAQTIAMCPGDHWVTRPDGGRDRKTTAQSSLARILITPNDYQHISDFLANLVRSWYSEGNAYAVAVRNARFEVQELHLMHPKHTRPRYSVTGEVFYDVGGNDIFERRFGSSILVPQRDVMHVRTQTPGTDPLKGVTPLMAAAIDMAASDAVMKQQIAYFQNRAKTSIILETDEKLTPEQTREARDSWHAQTTGTNAGRTPVAAWGFKAKAIQGSATDSQMVETLKMTDQRIALAFGVPLQVLGIGGQTMGSTEALMNSWLAQGLGFAINHVELAFDRFFKLQGQPVEYTEFSTRYLLRSSHKERMEALAQGVQAGVYAPDEARGMEDLGEVPFGDQPRLQQQMVPLSYGAQLEPPKPTPAPLPAPEPEPEPEAAPEPDEEEDDGERYCADDIVQRLYDHASGAIH